MSDYLIDSGFEEKIHLTTRSASTYGTGVFIGPLLRERVKSVADTDEFGNNIAKDVTYLEPFVESLDIFNWFPDLDSKNRDEQDYNFFYKTLNKRDLLKLAEQSPKRLFRFTDDRKEEFLKAIQTHQNPDFTRII